MARGVLWQRHMPQDPEQIIADGVAVARRMARTRDVTLGAIAIAVGVVLAALGILLLDGADPHLGVVVGLFAAAFTIVVGGLERLLRRRDR